jgi:hypothetical protein
VAELPVVRPAGPQAAYWLGGAIPDRHHERPGPVGAASWGAVGSDAGAGLAGFPEQAAAEVSPEAQRESAILPETVHGGRTVLDQDDLTPASALDGPRAALFAGEPAPGS